MTITLKFPVRRQGIGFVRPLGLTQLEQILVLLQLLFCRMIKEANRRPLHATMLLIPSRNLYTPTLGPFNKRPIAGMGIALSIA